MMGFSCLFEVRVNFEKWEKIGFDHDKNITITYFVALKQVNIIKI